MPGHKDENKSAENGNAEHAHRENAEEKAEASPSFIKPFLIVMIVLLAGFVVLNQYLINGMTTTSAASPATQNAAPASAGAASSDLAVIEAQILPTGVPPIYGSELGIRYDDADINSPQKANAVIAKLVALDDPNPKNSLTADQLKRFLDIGNQIGCEYCCGLGVMVTKDGGRPCGCQHSWAMRGLAQYLIKKHPEMTNDQILTEVAKWKTLFFPDNIGQKALVLKQQGIELTYINLASIKYKDIEKGTASGARQVGGC